MTYPKNPNNIVLKNKYYPKGLKEIDIYKYFLGKKDIILEQTKNRYVMIFIILEDGKLVVRKKWDNSQIILSSSNYDNIISGRCISIHSLMNINENIAIIDIDGDLFDNVKEATRDTYLILSRKTSFIKDCKIRYTGKTGFHIVCYLKKKMHVDSIRTLFYNLLSNTNLIDKYTIKSKRTTGKVNIDLYSNKVSGGFITLNSLSTIGLKCVEVNLSELQSFNKSKARI